MTKEPNNFIGAFISLLLLVCCPSAIFLTVPKVIVNPVNGVLIGRARPHVIKESFVGLPFFTDSKVSFCVLSSLKSFIARCPSLEVHPATIGSGLPSSTSRTGLSVLCFGRRNHFMAFTPTGFYPPLSQRETVDRFLLRALTSTPPMYVSVNVFMAYSYDCKKSKYFPGQVFDARVKYGSGILNLAHVVDGLRLSEGHSAATGGLCAVMVDENRKESI